MRSSFAGIEIGRTGLNISQLGLDVTGHNIANVETEGYTRQRIVQTAYDPFAMIGRAIPVSEALVGGGVRVAILDQIRSAYLDRRFRTENSINAYWQKRTEGLTYLESYFDNINEETSLNFSIAGLFGAVKVLSTDPVEGAPRKLLQTAGDDLAEHLHTIYDGLIDLQMSQNTAVKVTVEEINRMANEIVELNKSIYGFEVTGFIANDLRDKRNLLLDQMSALIPIEYREEPDGKGSQKLVVEIGGKTLVDHDKQNRLDVELGPNSIAGEEDVWVPIWAKQPIQIPNEDPPGFYTMYFTGLDETSPTKLTFAAATAEDAQLLIDRINEISRRFSQVTPLWADCLEYTDLLAKETAGTLDIIAGEDVRLAELRVIMDEPLALLNELQGLVPGVEIFPMQPDPWDWCIHTGLRLNGSDLVYACSNDINPQRAYATIRLEGTIDYLPSEPLKVTGGELKAYMDMRDNYIAGTALTPNPGIPYYIEMLNNLARALVQEMNEVHRQGWTDNPNGSETGINFFDETQGMVWEDGSGRRLTLDEFGDWVDEDGKIVINPASVYELIPDGGGPGVDIYEDQFGNQLTFNGTDWEDSIGTVVDPSVVYEEKLDLSLITAKNIRLSDEVIDSEYNIACSTTRIVKNGEPDELQRGNNENMNIMYELWSLKKDITIDVMLNGVMTAVDIGSFDGYVTAIRFDVANTLSYAKKTTTNSDILLTAAQNQRISVSGVSLDEEMINMVKFQHAYSGASRVITAMDEMLDRLINNTGRVGL